MKSEVLKSEGEISKEIQGFLNSIWVEWFWRNQVYRGRVKSGAFLQTGKPGVFDIILMSWGLIIFIENKTESGKLNEDQKLFKEFLDNNNHDYVVIRCVDDLKKYLEDKGVVCWI